MREPIASCNLFFEVLKKKNRMRSNFFFNSRQGSHSPTLTGFPFLIFLLFHQTTQKLVCHQIDSSKTGREQKNILSISAHHSIPLYPWRITRFYFPFFPPFSLLVSTLLRVFAQFLREHPGSRHILSRSPVIAGTTTTTSTIRTACIK